MKKLTVLLLALIAGAGWTAGGAAGELDGTAWRLVKIMSMDDTDYVPDDPSMYTLELQPGGAATMQADCNRGKSSWSSKSAGQLEFGPVASTRALCPPGSLSERYLAQFEWVRSYVMKEGHLFMATMADGSIIELEPADAGPAVATVLGEAVRATDPEEAQAVILTRLFDRYAAEQGIEAADAEIDTFVENLRRGMAKEGLGSEEGLTPEEVAEVEAGRRNMARALIRQWKLNKALYEQYGGRIIYQQFGPEPLDAYRRFLEERQAAGAFSIQDPALEERFWRYFRDDAIHTFMEPGGADEARAFATPPWEEKP